MSDTTLRDAIKALEQQEESIVEEFQKLEARLSQIRTAKSALQALENDEPMEFDGRLADACRRVLQSVGKRSLAPTEVRDHVKTLGYDLDKHKNVMAAVHSVLKRLKESGEVGTKEWSQVPGQQRYYWLANFIQAEGLAIQDTINASIESANRVVEQHHAARQRAIRAAMTSQPTVNPLLPPKETK